MGGDDDSLPRMAGNDLVSPGQHIIRCVAFQIQVQKVEILRTNSLKTVGIVAGDRRLGTSGVKRASVPVKFFETRLGKRCLKQRRVAGTHHIVVPDRHAVGDDSVNPIHAQASHCPLFGYVLVNDVANVTDEDDVLLLTILGNPIRDRLENWIANVFVVGRGKLCASSAIRLRIGEDGDCKRTRRGRSKSRVVSQNECRTAGKQDL